MKKKGLGNGPGGQGLEALFGDAAKDTTAKDFENLLIHKIEPRQEQPRTVFEQERIDELTDSIREHGVLSPIMVRSVEGGLYQIIAGERRWRAARAADLREIPARIVVADDKRALELALVENVQREDLSPIEEARGYRALMEEFGMTQEEVSQRVSKSRPAVANTLRLLALPGELTELVLRGELAAGSARALLGLKSEDTMVAAARMAVHEGMSVREVESLVRKLDREKIRQSKQSKKRVLEVDYLLDAKNRLTEALGRRVNIKQGRGKGKVEIEYYDLEDFNALFEELISKVQTEDGDDSND